MKHKFLATSVIFIVCVVVFVIVNANPVSINLRLNGTAYEEDKEIDNEITVTLTGNRHDKLFQRNTFTGYLELTSKTYPKDYDAIRLKFGKNGSATCKVTIKGSEFGTLTVDKEFQTLSLDITSQEYTKTTAMLAAPATDISQAQEIYRELH